MILPPSTVEVQEKIAIEFINRGSALIRENVISFSHYLQMLDKLPAILREIK